MVQTFLLGLIASFILASCSNSNTAPDITTPVANAPTTNTTLGEPGNQYEVLGNKAFTDKQADLRIVSPGSARGQRFLKSLASNEVVEDFGGETTGEELVTLKENSLTLGFPKGLLKEQQLFGGVITTVSDAESETLGRLKLTDVTPLHVRSLILEDKGKFSFVLAGCDEECTEETQPKNIQTIPIVGVDDTKGLIYLDLAALGAELNLVEILDPKGDYTKLKTKSSKTTAFDYSTSTLVFDVEATMVPIEGAPKEIKETKFTTRWYLKLNSAFNPGFTPRLATEGVGFFMTERAKPSRIQRWAIPLDGATALSDSTVKYYIKNVPEEHKAAFQAAFDGWNEKFVQILGKKLLSYEFISEKDPKAALLVPGDIRYKILEWDLKNRAPYGGLGPSIANQFTGEMLSANVLIQGPHIMVLYKAWFEAGKTADALIADGREAEAEAFLANAARALKASLEKGADARYELSLGKHIKFKVRSQEPSLEDPIMQRDDFEPLPKGVAFNDYMRGYFTDMVTHELGHNLGLRHNFRGNLSAAPGAPQAGKVTSSIMEYLGRNYRYLDALGPYDVMAIQYGYRGIEPAIKNGFCTDEDVPEKTKLTSSAECSRDDATPDPFGYFEGKLTRAVDLLTGRVLGIDPVWSVADMDKELTTFANGLGLYGLTAEASFDKWTNFGGKEDRPKTKAEVRQYALDAVLKQTCDSKLEAVAQQKPTQAGKEKVLQNIKDLRAKVGKTLLDLGFTEAEGQCKID